VSVARRAALSFAQYRYQNADRRYLETVLRERRGSPLMRVAALRLLARRDYPRLTYPAARRLLKARLGILGS